MSPPLIDTSRYPYVEITYQSSMTSADIDAYGQAYSDVCARGLTEQPCAMVIDIRATPTERASLRARQALVAHTNLCHATYPGGLLCEAVVLEGRVAAALYMAYLWLQTDTRVLRRAFQNKDEAQAWAKAQLAQSAHK